MLRCCAKTSQRWTTLCGHPGLALSCPALQEGPLSFLSAFQLTLTAHLPRLLPAKNGSHHYPEPTLFSNPGHSPLAPLPDSLEVSFLGRAPGWTRFRLWWMTPWRLDHSACFLISELGSLWCPPPCLVGNNRANRNGDCPHLAHRKCAGTGGRNSRSHAQTVSEISPRFHQSVLRELLRLCRRKVA